MTLTLPELSLVVLVGVSGSGKSTFARKRFGPVPSLRSVILENRLSQR